MLSNDFLIRLRPEIEQRVLLTRTKIAANDRQGVLIANLADDILELAILNYVLDRDVDAFHEKAEEAVRLRLSLFERRADETFRHLVSTAQYVWMFFALSAQLFALATQLAEALDAVRSDDISDAYCYSLKSVVLNDKRAAEQHLEVLAAIIRGSGSNPYVQMMSQMIADRPDPARIQHAISAMQREHRRAVMADDVFVAGTPRERLCLWGIGLANLARHRNLIDRLACPSDLIPSDLVI